MCWAAVAASSLAASAWWIALVSIAGCTGTSRTSVFATGVEQMTVMGDDMDRNFPGSTRFLKLTCPSPAHHLAPWNTKWLGVCRGRQGRHGALATGGTDQKGAIHWTIIRHLSGRHEEGWAVDSYDNVLITSRSYYTWWHHINKNFPSRHQSHRGNCCTVILQPIALRLLSSANVGMCLKLKWAELMLRRSQNYLRHPNILLPQHLSNFSSQI